jgi:hypothetical protein
MVKVFSARIDEKVLSELDRVTRRLGITKRQLLEEALRRHCEELCRETSADVWSETQGAWERREKPEVTVRKARRLIQQSFTRHHRHQNARLHR